MKVAVTGGSGQLGAQVLRCLIDEPTIHEILDLDRMPPPLASDKLDYREADVRDRDGLEAAFQGCDAVFHLAFAVTSKLPPEVFEAINVGGSENVFRAAVAAGAKQIIYCSSTAAYGVTEDLGHTIDESTPLQCQDDFPYAVAKYRVEKFLDGFETEYPDVRIARLRPPVLIGRSFGNPLGRSLAKSMALGILPLGGDTPMNAVWDQDVAAAAVLALHRGARGAFNLCADEPLTPAQLASALGLRQQKIPKPLVRLSMVATSMLAKLGMAEEVDPSWSHQGGAAMDISNAKAKVELEWQPSCPTVADVFRRFKSLAPGRDRRIVDFFRAIDRAEYPVPPEATDTPGPVHLCLLGPRGGDFILLGEDGRIQAREGVPRPPKSAATLDVELWREMIASQTTLADAQEAGKIRLEGDAGAGRLLASLLARVAEDKVSDGAAGERVRRQIRRLTRDF